MRTHRQIARKLNDHHQKFCAGFYLSNGDRCFRARVKAGVLEVMTWDTTGDEQWTALDLNTTTVHDHNGRRIFL